MYSIIRMKEIIIQNRPTLKRVMPDNSCRTFETFIIFQFLIEIFSLARPRGVMVKSLDCGIVVREFVLQSRYYVHFRANTLGKGMNPLILPAMG